jgi:hypothetical protein
MLYSKLRDAEQTDILRNKSKRKQCSVSKDHGCCKTTICKYGSCCIRRLRT